MLIFRQHQEVGSDVVHYGGDWLVGVGSGGQFRGNIFYWLFRRGLKHCDFDLLRHQAIGAYLRFLKDVSFAKQNFEDAHQSLVVINGQDHKGIGSELSTNVRFDPRIGVGIFHA
jgi:hypothetical protein